MAEAEQKLTVMRMTPEERHRYERYITNLVIEKDVIETSWEDGLAQGLSKGRSEGRLEERREIALRLQAAGWTVEQIGEFFGQPIDDVRQWLNESP
jgi:predicted transposase YdaD